MSYYSWALVSYFLYALENEVENEAIALGGGHGATTSDSREVTLPPRKITRRPWRAR